MAVCVRVTPHLHTDLFGGWCMSPLYRERLQRCIGVGESTCVCVYVLFSPA